MSSNPFEIESVTAVKLIRNLNDLPTPLVRGALTIGNFDGVHRGHAVLMERLVQQARAVGGPAIVFTFDPHPAQLLYPEAVPPALTWIERKAELLTELGADAIIAFPTDRTVLSLTPEAFFRRIICEQLQTRALVEGPNFFFGRDRAGSIADLRRLCHANNIELEIVQPVKVADRYVSSSWIRELIQAGDVHTADTLLTNPYRIHGHVVRGAGRGTKIGFPTANIDPVGMVLPPLGVYAGRAYVDGTTYAAAVNIGANPTFGENVVKLEAHLIGCRQTLYGRLLELDFLDRLRDIRPFENVAALQRQLVIDISSVQQSVDS